MVSTWKSWRLVLRSDAETEVIFPMSVYLLKIASNNSMCCMFVRGFSWDDPLLRMASDVARGMSYLHELSYFDEVDMSLKSCVLHRDLKV